MLAHISIGVQDINKSKRFYDTVLEPLGYKCLRAARSLLGYGYGRDSISFWVVQARAPGSTRRKVGSALLFCRTRCRRRRCVSRGGVGLRGTRCRSSAHQVC
jgi:hypothetical protein